jgi:hypothetical protein
LAVLGGGPDGGGLTTHALLLFLTLIPAVLGLYGQAGNEKKRRQQKDRSFHGFS